MSKTVIKVDTISKRYRLGLKEKKADTFAGALANMVKAPIQNFKRLRSLSSFDKDDESVFWALKEVSFEVKEGEVLGIIGKNGAGKSTLLKILSQITEPTSGQIEISGRVASLLEVGTGFHPELTGRENIYMNGTILGMTKKEIYRKLDEIVDFSGVEKFLDTPVKFYSSGMKVRLGFSVAAHLEPEILIIDEVLAVGDFEFQNKCLGKMQDVASHGRTVLFVSHNLGAISSLCSRALLFHQGKIICDDRVHQTLNQYMTTGRLGVSTLEDIPFEGPLRDKIHFEKCLLNSLDTFQTRLHFKPQELLQFEFKGSTDIQHPVRIIFSLYKDGIRLFSLHDVRKHSIINGKFQSNFKIHAYFLRPGIYTVALGAHTSKDEWLWSEQVYDFEITEVFDEYNDKRDFGLVNVQNLSSTERVVG